MTANLADIEAVEADEYGWIDWLVEEHMRDALADECVTCGYETLGAAHEAALVGVLPESVLQWFDGFFARHAEFDAMNHPKPEPGDMVVMSQQTVNVLIDSLLDAVEQLRMARN